MPMYKTEIWAGDVYEAEIYFSPREAGKNVKRGANRNLSSDQQAERNLRNARKKLARLINANFDKRDRFVTLTYEREPEDIPAAKKNMAKFFRRLRNARRKEGLPELKYIAVTEQETARMHHHVILSATDLDVLQELWPHGIVIMSPIRNQPDNTGLAHYVTKELGQGKRWSQSRNLQKPKVRRRKITSKRPRLNPPKGYHITVEDHYYSEVLGGMVYLKAIRTGGVDYSETGLLPRKGGGRDVS